MIASGTAVVLKASGEVGVVIRAAGPEMVEVSLPGGVRLVHLDELRLNDPEPDELLLSGRFGDPNAYGLRLQALYLRHAYRFDPLSGLSNARIEPQFHQVFVAWRVNQKLQPRMILADEVGLGKTIEAGLIIKELRARGLANRVLIVCPASLQLQWQQELRTKFNESFEVIDGAGLKYLSRGGANPWLRFDSVICSLPFASHRSRVDTVVETDWDLVVFDEAHRVRRWLQGRKAVTTQAYRLADELKELVPGLLMLSATPMQLHPYELYSMIELVEPGLYPTFEAYERQKASLPRLNDLIRGLRAWTTMSAEDAEKLCSNHAEFLEEAGLGMTPAAELASEPLRDRTISTLAKKHPLAEVLVRNRKTEVGGFVGREATSVLVDLSEEEQALYAEITEYCRTQYDLALANKNQAVGFLMVTYQKMLASSGHAIRASFEKRLLKLKKALQESALKAKTSQVTPAGAKVVPPDDDALDAEEMSDVIDAYAATVLDGALLQEEIDTLTGLVSRLGQIQESKAFELLEALDHLFKAHPDEKVLIFTGFKETQSFLRRVLEGNGHSVSIFNGSLSLDEKEDAVRAFRTKHRVLISTEAGGEGRNFQFCHILLNYDLPWNPMKVEQRIGRVDRIGQSRTVQIWNLACRDTVEERILGVLEHRIGLFEESVGSLDPILGTIEEDIVSLVMSKISHLADEGERFELDLEQKVRKARETEKQLADFALDRASFRRDIVNDLFQAHSLATHSDLESYARSVLAREGGALHPHSEGGMVITLSPQAKQHLRLKDSTIRGCFDPQEALRYEELQFFAFGNPLVETLLDAGTAAGSAATARRGPAPAPGTWIEAWYELEANDVRARGSFLRHVIGPDLQVHSSVVVEMPDMGERIEPPGLPGWSADALRVSRERYQDEYLQLRDEAKSTLSERQSEERARVQRIFDYRQERMARIVADELGWIERAEAGTNEREKRVLPARRGKLEKRREALHSLREAFAADIARIDAQEPVVQGRFLAAGVVVNS